MIDHDKFQTLVKQLYATVTALEEMFPGRHFTPDGHMVGSLGECLVADAYGLELKTASNKGYDAVTTEGMQVEIKATQSNSVAFRCQPQHTIIIKILPGGCHRLIMSAAALVFVNSTALARKYNSACLPLPPTNYP